MLMKKILIAASVLALLFGEACYAMEVSRADTDITISGEAAAGEDVRLNVTSSDGELIWLDSTLSDSGKYGFTFSLPVEDETREYIFSVNASDKENIKLEGTNEIIGLFKTCGESEFSSLVEIYAKRFDLDSKIYGGLSDKSDAYKIFKSFTITDANSVKNAYFAAAAISLINEGGRGDCLSVLQKYSQYIAKNYESDISSLTKSQKEKFAIALSSKDYSSLSDFESAYDKALSDAKKPSKTNSGSSGGGSVSGGRGGAVSPPANTPSEDNKPSNDAEPAQNEPFSDISGVQWAKSSILKLYEKGIVKGKGDGIFAPDDAVSREEFTAMLVRAAGLKAEAAEVSFSDVAAGAWYIESIAAAFENGIILGISENEFGIGMSVTRQDCAAICARLLEKSGTACGEIKESFSDDADISDYAKDGVYMLKELGILSGTGDNNFEPKGVCTRAQAAKIIDLVSEYLK